MKKSLLIFAALAFLSAAHSFAQEEIDYDTEIQESEETGRAKKEKVRVKRTKRAGQDVAVQKGLVRMETVGSSGAVLFYVVNGKKIFPAVETKNYGESNYISLYLENREYRLNKKGNCDYHFEVGDDSITEIFTVKNVAEVKAVYTISKIDSKDELENSVGVKYSLRNLTGKNRAFALKAVYNLCLG